MISTVFKRNCSVYIDFIHEKLLKIKQNDNTDKNCSTDR